MRLKDRWPLYAMFLAFAYAGFALLLFAFQAYLAFWMKETLEAAPLPPFGGHRLRSLTGLAALTAPHNILLLVSGLISLYAGLTIWQLTRRRELTQARKETLTAFLLPAENQVLELLKDSGGMAQSKLVSESGLTKVQVHRIVKKLESKGILTKHRYGLTNKLVLTKPYDDSPHAEAK